MRVHAPASSCAAITTAPSLISPPTLRGFAEYPVRLSGMARWVRNAVDTSAAAASYSSSAVTPRSTSAEVQEKWRAAVSASICDGDGLQADSNLRDLLQVRTPALVSKQIHCL